MSEHTTAASRLDNAIKQLRLAREATDDAADIARLDIHIAELKRVRDNHE
jgi:hypothetical protein